MIAALMNDPSNISIYHGPWGGKSSGSNYGNVNSDGVATIFTNWTAGTWEVNGGWSGEGTVTE